MSDEFEINISPGAGVLRLFQNMSYTPWFALGEFIDNSITSVIKVFSGSGNTASQAKNMYGENGEDYKLKINIDFINDPKNKNNNKIVIKDNAFGISQNDISRAFKMGEVPIDISKGLSKHGIGMKAAALWFGSVIKIKTFPIAEPIGYELTIRISGSDQDAIVKVSKIPKPTSNPHYHGTTIEVSQLKNDIAAKAENRTVKKIKAYLPSIYRTFVGEISEDGIFRAPKHEPASGFVYTEIKINTHIDKNVEPLVYQEPKLHSGPYWHDTLGPHAPEIFPNTDPENIKLWRCEFDFTVGPDKKRVSGWYGIMAETSREVSGFYLHYRGKGIAGIDAGVQKSEAIAAAAVYKPKRIFGQEGSLKYNGLTGVIDMSAFGKSITTDQLQWSPDEEEEFIESLLSHMKNPHKTNLNNPDEPHINYPRMLEKLRRKPSKSAEKEQVKDIKEGIAEINAKADGKNVKHYDSVIDLSHNSLEEVVKGFEYSEELDPLEVKTLRDKYSTAHIYRIFLISEPEISDFVYVSHNKLTDDEIVYNIYINQGHPFIASDTTGAEAKSLLVKLVLTYAISHIELLGDSELDINKAIVAWSKTITGIGS